MNSITVSIPNRWEKGAYQIKSAVETYCCNVRQSLTVNISGESDPGQIWITNRGELLTQEENDAAENAVHILNNRLHSYTETGRKVDEWKGRTDAEMELEKQLIELDNIFLKSK
jgi:hypothetical protein